MSQLNLRIPTASVTALTIAITSAMIGKTQINQPATIPPLEVASITLNPSTVTGTMNSVGPVTVNAAARAAT